MPDERQRVGGDEDALRATSEHERRDVLDCCQRLGRLVEDDDRVQASKLAERAGDRVQHRIRGPGVTDLQKIFLHDWDEFAGWEREAGCPQEVKYGFACPQGSLTGDAQYTPPQAAVGGAKTRPILSDPRSQKTPLGYLAYLNLTRTAQKTLYIANSYFVPPRRLRKHLKAAVARGVRVVVVTNSLQSTDAWWMYYASLNYYKELIGAGIEVRHYRGTETMHAKTMLVDGEVALVGSFNLDPRSATTNSESRPKTLLNVSTPSVPVVCWRWSAYTNTENCDSSLAICRAFRRSSASTNEIATSYLRVVAPDGIKGTGLLPICYPRPTERSGNRVFWPKLW